MYCIDRDLLPGSYRSRAPIAKKKRGIRYATQSIMQESATGDMAGIQEHRPNLALWIPVVAEDVATVF
jgi:hypothetical protein